MGPWICVFAITVTTVCAAPVLSPPDGWLLIPGRVVDSYPGVYHDAVSGALVAFDAHGRDAPPAAPYTIEVKPNLHAGESDQPFPPDRADRLRIVFRGNGTNWHFTADVCNAEQDARVRDLLLGPGARLCLGRTPAEPAEPQRVSDSSYSQVKDGDSAAGVMRRLGIPHWAIRLGCGGFQLGYVFERDGRTVLAELEFDRRQRLVRREEKVAP